MTDDLDLLGPLPEWEPPPAGTEWALRCERGWLDASNRWTKDPAAEVRTWSSRAAALTGLRVARRRTGFRGKVTVCRRLPEAGPED